jgi:type I restriction enzyme S subunit
LDRYRLFDGDIVIARTGATTGYSTYIANPPDAVFASYLVRLKIGKEANSRFIAYFLKSQGFWEYMRGVLGDKSAQPNASASTMSQVKLTLPPLPDQQAIAHILGSLDDKIENNRRMNETMEAMSRAIFKSWFVDFDPVHAKAAGRNPSGMDAATAKLFPDSFEDSPLGKIPKGWEIQELRERASNVQYGFTTSAVKEPVGPKFLRITDIQGGTVDWNAVPYCGISADDIPRYRIIDGDILVARTGASTGENIYVTDPPDAVFASYLVRIQFSSPYIARVVGTYLRTPDYFEYVASSIGGSAQPNASAQVLSGAAFTFPPESIANGYWNIVRPFDLAMAAMNRQSHTLTTIRDALLPKLLSGELNLRAVDKIVEANI